MLDRIVSKDKEKVQFYLEPAMIKYIRIRSAEKNRTQSKFIADLVEYEKQPNQFNMDALRILLDKSLCDIGHLNNIDSDVVDALAEDILKIMWNRSLWQ